jgi:hypothetical protein
MCHSTPPVQQETEPVVVEVAEAVADPLDFLDQQLIASVGPLEIGPVVK